MIDNQERPVNPLEVRVLSCYCAGCMEGGTRCLSVGVAGDAVEWKRVDVVDLRDNAQARVRTRQQGQLEACHAFCGELEGGAFVAINPADDAGGSEGAFWMAKTVAAPSQPVSGEGAAAPKCLYSLAQPLLTDGGRLAMGAHVIDVVWCRRTAHSAAKWTFAVTPHRQTISIATVIARPVAVRMGGGGSKGAGQRFTVSSNAIAVVLGDK